MISKLKIGNSIRLLSSIKGIDTHQFLKVKLKLSKQLATSKYNNDKARADDEIKWMIEYIVKNKSVSALDQGELSSKSLNTKEEIIQLEDMVNQRINFNQPLQYLLGTQPFGDLMLKVCPPTLIPRWETENWCFDLSKSIKEYLLVNPQLAPLKIIDLGTGSGCIPLLLSSELPPKTVHLYGFDICISALSLAKENMRLNQNLIKNDVTFLPLDMMEWDQVENLKDQIGTVDMIISNPPYIPPNEYAELDKDVKDWEDPGALLAKDEFGIMFYERINQLATKLLSLNIKSSKRFNNNNRLPSIVFEVGGTFQAILVADLLKSNFSKVEIINDLAGKGRVVKAY